MIRVLLPCLVPSNLRGQPDAEQNVQTSPITPQLCHAVALRALLPCLGGVRALLPLAAQLDLPAAG